MFIAAISLPSARGMSDKLMSAARTAASSRVNLAGVARFTSGPTGIPS